jgi:hypothetical protein
LARGLADTREVAILVVAAAAVFVPFWLGARRGQVPKEAIVRWALPLSLATAAMIAVIRHVNRMTDPAWKLGLSAVIGLLWVVAGFQTAFFQPRVSAESPENLRRAMRAIGWTLLGFGLLWLALAVARFR